MATDRRSYWLMLGTVASAVFIFYWYQCSYNPRVYYLTDSVSASWIRDNIPFDANAKPFKQEVKLFKKYFTLAQPVQNIVLNIKAFKFVRVFIDGSLVYESNTDVTKWKVLHKVAISKLEKGEHELVIMGMNYDGPVAVLAYVDTLPLKTDSTWLINTGRDKWTAAALVDAPRTSDISTKFPPAYKKLIATIPIGVLAFLLVFTISRSHVTEKFRFNSGKLRWILLGCWAVLMANGLLVTKLMGFDMIHHVEYVQFILNNGRLPLATDGLQMFQSPFFYIISALFVKLSSVIFNPKLSFHLLKVIPFFCGLAMVEVCYRCARLAFPDRDDLQCVALLVGAMMPVNLYMSQYFSNEPLLGILSALCVLMVLTWIRNPEYAVRDKQQMLLGMLLGLAVLTKATAIILVMIVLTSQLLILLQSGSSKKVVTASVLRVVSVILVIAGWYYLRNWLVLGKPFVGGWDTGRGLTWWQEPGYRNLSNFVTFGQALIYPIYAATHSFWDAFYSTLWADGLLGSQSTFETRPPWNYGYILATVWLSLIPTVGILVALFWPIRSKIFELKTTNMVLFCSCSILLYLLAVIYMYFHLPIYSTVKASYSMGLLPCYAILAAFGLARFMENKISRSVIASILIWWSVSAYLGYFSLGVAT